MATNRGMTLFYRLSGTRIYKQIWKYWYPFVTKRLVDENVVFLNWAYEEDPPLGIPLSAADEPNRYHIQLYHRTAAQADLTGKKVLEVSCGHGGGASYLMRTMHPSTYTALDLNPAGIEFCRRTHQLPNLDFVQGNAESLPFDDDSFEVVLNVEASHCYPHLPVFLAEVARVMKPGAHFLYADLRAEETMAAWNADLAAASLEEISQTDITDEVLRGLELNTPRAADLARRHLPAALSFVGREFAGAKGSRVNHGLAVRDMTYRMYSFVKP